MRTSSCISRSIDGRPTTSNPVSIRIAAFVATVLAAVCPALAQVTTPAPSPPPASGDLARERADAMLRSGHADPTWFSQTFLTEVPAVRVDAILQQLKTNLGSYQRIDGTRGDYIARFQNGTDEVLVALDSQKLISGLFFKAPKLQAASLDAGLRGLRPSTGTLSYVVTDGKSDVASFDASSPLAVGSAFKLAVLAAIRDQIARGRRHWNDVVALRDEWKSLPSGVLRQWPPGTPITLATYATEMISISDNTAADALVRLAGPAALAPYALRNVPFLTTREVFVLKSAEGVRLRTAYLAARTPAARSAVLPAADALPLPGASSLESTPILDIEWHYSVRELCGLMRRVADLPLMSVNPGEADLSSFASVAYKGGSDIGVLNMTTQVTTKRGHTICFSATVNDSIKSVDESAFELAYGAVLNALVNR